MSKLIILATRVLKLKVTRPELVDILQLKVVWDNGTLIASPAVLVSIDQKIMPRVHSHDLS